MVTVINDWNDLNNVRNNLSGDYELGNDLDSNTAGYNTYASSNANGGAGWNPIGDSNNKFTGTFDGKNYTISDLYMDRVNIDYVGLFSFLNGTLDNLFIKNITIKDSGRYTGSLSGKIEGSVSKVGIVSGSITSSNYDTGGFCGWTVGNINKCFSGVSIENSGGNTGGFCGRVGDTFNTGSISNCYVMSDKVYTTDIQSPKRAGGFCGFITDGDINNSYAVVKDLKNINSGEQDDGIYYFVGELFVDGNVSDIYADTAIETTAGLKEATGLTTSEMKGDSANVNMSGLDFSSIWNEVTSSQYSADGYPILKDLDQNLQIDIQVSSVSKADGIVAGSNNNNIYTYDLNFSLNNTLQDPTDDVESSVFIKNTGDTVIGAKDNTVYIYNDSYSLKTTLTDPTGSVKSVAYNSNTNELAVGGFDNTVYIYNTANNYSLKTTLTGQSNTIYGMSYNENNDNLAVGTTGNQAIVYDSSYSVSNTLTYPDFTVNCVDYNQNTGQLALGTVGTEVLVYDSSYSLTNIIKTPDTAVHTISFLEDRDELATGEDNGRVNIHDINNFGSVIHINTGAKPIYSSSYSSSSDELFVGDGGGTIYSYDVTNFSSPSPKTRQDSTQPVNTLTLSKSGSTTTTKSVDVSMDSVNNIDTDGGVYSATINSISNISNVFYGFRITDTNANFVDLFTGNTKSVSNLSLPLSYSDGSNNLNDNTTYNVEAVVVDADTNKAYYSDTSISFTTKGALKLRADPPTNIKGTSADLNGAIESSNLSRISNVDIYYEILDPSDGSIIKQEKTESVDLSNISFEYNLNDVVSGLTKGETYDMRWIAVKNEEDDSDSGWEVEFSSG